jgi:hypothetical protein
MPIPTEADRRLAEIADLHALILVRLGIALRGGDAKAVRPALQDYADKVIEAVNQS